MAWSFRASGRAQGYAQAKREVQGGGGLGLGGRMAISRVKRVFKAPRGFAIRPVEWDRFLSELP